MTNKTVKLFEASRLVREEAREDGAFKVRIISEGKGSSGIYPAKLLEDYFGAFDESLSF